MKKPLLSVCILTYNHASYIREALDSALAQQTNFEWQLIVADDCSTDGTRDILQEYKSKYPDRITLILQKKNVGPEENWLDLISYPKTKYLLYAEGDDYFIEPTKLQQQVDFLETHPDYALCFHPVKVVYEDGSRPDEIFPTPEMRGNKKIPTVDDLLKVNFIQTNSVVYRWRYTKQNIKELFPRGTSPGDWILHLLHAEKGKIGFIDRAMSVYRRHPGGIWWDAYADRAALWKRWGMRHLRTYDELIRRYGNTPKRRAILFGAVFSELDALVDIDRKEGSHLFKEAFMAYPEEVEAYVQSQQTTINNQAKDIKKLWDDHARKDTQITDKEAQLIEQDQRLQAISASKIWKARNKVAKIIGKKVI